MDFALTSHGPLTNHAPLTNHGRDDDRVGEPKAGGLDSPGKEEDGDDSETTPESDS